MRAIVTATAALMLMTGFFEPLRAQRHRIVTGVVRSVSAGRIEVALNASFGPGLTRGSEISVIVPAGTPVRPQTMYVSRESLTLADLRPGDEVTVRFVVDPAGYAATAITLTSAAGRKKDGDFTRNVPSRVAPTTPPGVVGPDSSTLTLEQTTSFLKSALESGGKHHMEPGGAGSWHDIGDVQVRGCVLEWVEKFHMPNPTQNTMQEYRYSVDLGGIPTDRIRTAPTSGEVVLTGARSSPIHKYYKQYQGNRLVNQYDDTMVSGGEARLYLTHQDDLDRRVAEALKHAGRLCAGK